MGLGLLEDMLLGTMVGSQKARDDDLRLGTVGRKHTMLIESRRQTLISKQAIARTGYLLV